MRSSSITARSVKLHGAWHTVRLHALDNNGIETGPKFSNQLLCKMLTGSIKTNVETIEAELWNHKRPVLALRLLIRFPFYYCRYRYRVPPSRDLARGSGSNKELLFPSSPLSPLCTAAYLLSTIGYQRKRHPSAEAHWSREVTSPKRFSATPLPGTASLHGDAKVLPLMRISEEAVAVTLTQDANLHLIT